MTPAELKDLIDSTVDITGSRGTTGANMRFLLKAMIDLIPGSGPGLPQGATVSYIEHVVEPDRVATLDDPDFMDLDIPIGYRLMPLYVEMEAIPEEGYSGYNSGGLTIMVWQENAYGPFASAGDFLAMTSRTVTGQLVRDGFDYYNLRMTEGPDRIFVRSINGNPGGDGRLTLKVRMAYMLVPV